MCRTARTAFHIYLFLQQKSNNRRRIAINFAIRSHAANRSRKNQHVHGKCVEFNARMNYGGCKIAQINKQTAKKHRMQISFVCNKNQISGIVTAQPHKCVCRVNGREKETKNVHFTNREMHAIVCVFANEKTCPIYTNQNTHRNKKNNHSFWGCLTESSSFSNFSFINSIFLRNKMVLCCGKACSGWVLHWCHLHKIRTSNW